MIRKKPSSRARARDYMWRKARHKRYICEHLYWDHTGWYNNLHQYSKNKIHCSCPDCSPKTRNKGRRKSNNYSRSINYKISDLRKWIDMNDQENEYQFDF